MRQHGGEILVESQPGIGTEFQLCLPLAEVAEDAARAGASAPTSMQAKAARQARERACILVVDDDPEILRLTTALLRSAGFATLQAGNGADALEQLAGHRNEVSLVLMDVLMPILGGREAAARMRESDPELPVILMSGYVPDPDQPTDLRLLRKPFTRVTLLDAITSALPPPGT
jgi:CheY-like chemotaxis protein